VRLDGPTGFLFGIIFLCVWAFVTVSAVMTARHSSAKTARWFIVPAPAESLSPEGRRWRRRYLIGLAIAAALLGLAFLILSTAR
jgi:hypothetical protein